MAVLGKLADKGYLKERFMRKVVASTIFLLFSGYICFASTQPYKDFFYIVNQSSYDVYIQYRESKILTPNPYGFSLDIGEGYKINVGLSSFYDAGGYGVLHNGAKARFSLYTHSNKKFYKMGWFARFLLISGELIVKDENGNILMTLDTITPEDFEVTEEAGITTATLVIRDK
jgi:hypothetical protein